MVPGKVGVEVTIPWITTSMHAMRHVLPRGIHGISMPSGCVLWAVLILCSVRISAFLVLCHWMLNLAATQKEEFHTPYSLRLSRQISNDVHQRNVRVQTTLSVICAHSGDDVTSFAKLFGEIL